MLHHVVHEFVKYRVRDCWCRLLVAPMEARSLGRVTLMFMTMSVFMNNRVMFVNVFVMVGLPWLKPGPCSRL